MTTMRKFVSIVVVLGIGAVVLGETGLQSHLYNEVVTSDSEIGQAFANRASDVQVEGSGQVVRVLTDDVNGDRHQRFILRISSGQTLLVAHNIDLAPRLPQLQVGDTVEFFGEYEWNDQGGVVHWTHRDSQGRHVDGWLRNNGKTYQ